MPALTDEGGVTPLLDEASVALLTEALVSDFWAWTDLVATRTVAVVQASGAVITTVQSSGDDHTPDPVAPQDAP